ncbi:MAG: dihydroneopterin aldolase [Bacteroidia bacterium]|nr:dihydroneopterin aldolase [Bacteroidia bacterium]
MEYLLTNELTMGIIEIKNISIWARIGWYDEELLIANEFRISVKLWVRVNENISELNETVDYASVSNSIKIVFQQPVTLLEQINEHIAFSILNDFQVVDKLVVKVKKMHPSIGVKANSVSYKKEWHRLT